MWNVPPTNISFLDCFIGSVVSYAKFEQKPYELGLLKFWDFKYEQRDNLNINENMTVHNNDRFMKTVERSHGVNISIHYLANKKNLLSFINHNINKSPIIMSLNAYICPWTKAYKKYSMEHCILVVGACKIGLLCSDSYFPSENHHLLPFENLNNWNDRVFTFSINNISNNYDSFAFEIQDSLKYIEKNDIIGNLCNFKKHMSALETFDSDFNKYGNDYYAVPLLIKLDLLGNGRKAFSFSLQCIGENINILNFSSASIDSFEKTSLLYQQLKNVIIRQAITKKINVEQNTRILNGIIEQEKENIVFIKELLRKIEFI